MRIGTPSLGPRYPGQADTPRLSWLFFLRWGDAGLASRSRRESRTEGVGSMGSVAVSVCSVTGGDGGDDVRQAEGEKCCMSVLSNEPCRCCPLLSPAFPSLAHTVHGTTHTREHICTHLLRGVRVPRVWGCPQDTNEHQTRPFSSPKRPSLPLLSAPGPPSPGLEHEYGLRGGLVLRQPLLLKTHQLPSF